jgi:hypothetical protein
MPLTPRPWLAAMACSARRAQREEFTAGDIRIPAIDLVHDQVPGLLTLSQVPGQLLIDRGQAVVGIHQQQHHIRLVDSQQ